MGMIHLMTQNIFSKLFCLQFLKLDPPPKIYKFLIIEYIFLYFYYYYVLLLYNVYICLSDYKANTNTSFRAGWIRRNITTYYTYDQVSNWIALFSAGNTIWFVELAVELIMHRNVCACGLQFPEQSSSWLWLMRYCTGSSSTFLYRH